MVLSLCRRYLRDPRDIEDAFQATFLVLVRKAPSIRERRAALELALRRGLQGLDAGPVASCRCGEAGRRTGSIAWNRRSDASAARIGRGRPGARPGAEPAAREVPGAAGALLPERPDARAGGRRARVAGGDGAEPPGAGPRAAPRPAHPPGLLALRGAARRWGPELSLVPSPPRSRRRSCGPPWPRRTVPPGRLGRCRAGLGAGASALYPTLSGSATTLAQGVLTTMALTQMKVIGAGLVAAGMLAGGAGAGAGPWHRPAPGAGGQALHEARGPGARPAHHGPSHSWRRPILRRHLHTSARSFAHEGSRTGSPALQSRAEARSLAPAARLAARSHPHRRRSTPPIAVDSPFKMDDGEPPLPPRQSPDAVTPDPDPDTETGPREVLPPADVREVTEPPVAQSVPPLPASRRDRSGRRLLGLQPHVPRSRDQPQPPPAPGKGVPFEEDRPAADAGLPLPRRVLPTPGSPHPSPSPTPDANLQPTRNMPAPPDGQS